jgi:hypothetical protein
MAALSCCARAGDTRFQGAALAGAAALAFLLDWPLAFGVPGVVPGLGLAGLGVAASLAWSAMLVVALWRLRRLGMLGAGGGGGFAGAARRVMRVGVPAAATNAIIPLATGLFTAMMAAHGTAAVAGFAVGSRVETLCMTAFFALSAIANPFAAQNLGAGRMDRVRTGMRASLIFCAGLGLALAVALWLFAGWLAHALSPDAEVAASAALYLTIMPWGFGAVGAIAVVNAAFNGLERPFAAVAVSLARTLALGVPAAWLGGHLAGEAGTLAGILAANLLVGAAAGVAILRARGQSRRVSRLRVGTISGTVTTHERGEPALGRSRPFPDRLPGRADRLPRGRRGGGAARAAPRPRLRARLPRRGPCHRPLRPRTAGRGGAGHGGGGARHRSAALRRGTRTAADAPVGAQARHLRPRHRAGGGLRRAADDLPALHRRATAEASVVAGLGLALSSTALAMQLMEERGERDTPHGRVTFSVLLLQDLAIVPLLALVAFLAPGDDGEAGGWRGVLAAVGAVAAVILVGRYLLDPLFRILARTGAREVMTAAALLVVLGAAALMSLVGLSMAMGRSSPGCSWPNPATGTSWRRISSPSGACCSACSSSRSACRWT